MSDAFRKSAGDISLAVTVYLIFQAVTPSFFGAASDSYGRRPIWLFTMTIYLGANIGLAVCPTNAFWLLLVLRAIQATGGSAVLSIGAGAVSDIAAPREKGKYMSVFQCRWAGGRAYRRRNNAWTSNWAIPWRYVCADLGMEKYLLVSGHCLGMYGGRVN